MPPKKTSEKSQIDERTPSDDTQTSFARQTGKVREIFSIPAPIKKFFSTTKGPNDEVCIERVLKNTHGTRKCRCD